MEGRPSEESSQDSPAGDTTPLKTQCTLRIMVDIAMSNGLRLSQKNLSYRELRQLIEKLEVLC